MGEILHNGQWFESIAELARAYDMDYQLVYSRIRRGKSIDEAISPGRLSNKTKKSYGGKIYPSLTALAADLDLPYSLLHTRISRGMSLEEAIETPYQKRRK